MFQSPMDFVELQRFYKEHIFTDLTIYSANKDGQLSEICQCHRMIFASVFPVFRKILTDVSEDYFIIVDQNERYRVETVISEIYECLAKSRTFSIQDSFFLFESDTKNADYGQGRYGSLEEFINDYQTSSNMILLKKLEENLDSGSKDSNSYRFSMILAIDENFQKAQICAFRFENDYLEDDVSKICANMIHLARHVTKLSIQNILSIIKHYVIKSQECPQIVPQSTDKEIPHELNVSVSDFDKKYTETIAKLVLVQGDDIKSLRMKPMFENDSFNFQKFCSIWQYFLKLKSIAGVNNLQFMKVLQSVYDNNSDIQERKKNVRNEENDAPESCDTLGPNDKADVFDSEIPLQDQKLTGHQFSKKKSRRKADKSTLM